MAKETILQHWIFTQFILPFLLIFAIIFAILEKTNLLGDGKHQVNAIVAFVIGIIFVSAAYPKEVVGNLILFLTVALIVVFVTLLLWGFVSGGDMKGDILQNKGLKITIIVVLVIVMIIAVLWASGIQGGVFDLLFRQSWSSAFWTNVAFVAVIAGALALMLRSSGK